MKKILALLFALVMVFSLTACHKDDEDDGPEYAGGETTTVATNNLAKFEGKKLYDVLKIVQSGNYYLQTELNGTLATYTHIGDDIMVTLDAEAGRYYLLKMSDGTYYFADERGYFEVTESFETQYADYADVITSCKDLLATLDAIPISWWTLEPTDGINVTLKNVASHEEYIDKYSSTASVICFLFDANDKLMGITDLGDGTNKNPTVFAMTIAYEDPASNAISNIFARTNYADTSSTTVAAQ